jgi:hypothetical protein
MPSPNPKNTFILLKKHKNPHICNTVVTGQPESRRGIQPPVFSQPLQRDRKRG